MTACDDNYFTTSCNNDYFTTSCINDNFSTGCSNRKFDKYHYCPICGNKLEICREDKTKKESESHTVIIGLIVYNETMPVYKHSTISYKICNHCGFRVDE